MAEQFRLITELVPKTSWYKNMRSVLPKAEWRRICQQVYTNYNHHCGICGAEGSLHCHEIWKYDDEHHIQTLQGFIALCNWCHHIKHLGLAGILAAKGRLDYEEVVQHFITVNECTRKSFEAYKQQVFIQWQARSHHQWSVQLGQYETLILYEQQKLREKG